MPTGVVWIFILFAKTCKWDERKMDALGFIMLAPCPVEATLLASPIHSRCRLEWLSSASSERPRLEGVALGEEADLGSTAVPYMIAI